MFKDITTAYNLRDASGEILIMLLVAFILGYLLRYFMDKRMPTVEAVKEPMSVYLGKEFATNDLKIVEGIGPKIEGLLRERGIVTWEDLAGSSRDTLVSILSAAGDKYRMHNPSTWPEQAALAHKGEWKELKEYQDFLVGGV